MSSNAPTQRLPAGISGWDRLRRPVWLFDPVSLRGLYANGSALELWDAETLPDLLARDFSQLSPAVRTRVDRLAQATAGGGTVMERWSFYPKGRPVTVQAVISTFELLDGTSVLLFEAAPAEAGEDELRAVEALRHTSSLITLFDGAGVTTFTNPAAFAAYGARDGGFAAHFVNQEEGAEALGQVLAGDVLADLRQVDTAHGQRWHYLDARRVVDPVSGAESVLLSERDVTAQVEAEQALQAARDRVELARSKQRFLANMSHELRTPLNSILGFAGVLQAGELAPEQVGQLARISGAGRTLLQAINDMIDFAELDGGDISLHAAPVDLVGVLEEALGAIEPQAEAKGLVLEATVSGAIPVIADAARVRTVLVHYLANAVKFTDHGRIDVSLAGQPQADGSIVVEASVSDTGPGIHPSAHGLVFQPFSLEDDSATKLHAGRGLGLAICRQLIELMDGEVGVESAPGLGSRFWFRLNLPAAQIEDEAMEAGGVLKVLYADDHESNRALVQTLLASLGHTCETVCDGAEAVQAVRDGAYDLVLMDIQMPVKDGVEASLEIRALPGPQAGTPIIALTANTLAEQRQSYARAGMNDCIAKPVKVTELFEKVTYWAAASAQSARRTTA